MARSSFFESLESDAGAWPPASICDRRTAPEKCRCSVHRLTSTSTNCRSSTWSRRMTCDGSWLPASRRCSCPPAWRAWLRSWCWRKATYHCTRRSRTRWVWICARTRATITKAMTRAWPTIACRSASQWRSHCRSKRFWSVRIRCVSSFSPLWSIEVFSIIANCSFFFFSSTIITAASRKAAKY